MNPPMKRTVYCTRIASMRELFYHKMGREYDDRHHFDTFILVFDMDTSESAGYKDFEWAIQLNRLSLELVGLWPKTDAKKRLGPNIRMGFTFIMVAFISGIPFIHALIRVWGDMVLMIDNLRITLPLMSVLLELVIVRCKQTVLSSLINMIAEDWLTPKLKAERDVMIKCASTARLLTIYGYALTISTFFLLIVIPCLNSPFRHLTNLTDRNKPLPLQSYYLYDTDKTPQFELTFLAQAITILVTILIYIGINAFLAFVILHICGQLENFKHQIINLVSCRDFNKALNNCIVTHLRLIRFANNSENTFTLILFVCVFQFGIVFCLCGFVFLTVLTDENVNNMSNFSEMSYMIISVLCLLLQTFFYCFGGDLISDRCDAVYRAIYDLEWYTWEPHKAKNLILLMLLAKEPFCITAGKILPLTMATFSSLIKTSAGYMSFLLAKRN